METTTNPEAKMTIAERTEQIYTAMKFTDRMTPGRTPWQTLRRRAEAAAAAEMLTDADRIAQEA